MDYGVPFHDNFMRVALSGSIHWLWLAESGEILKRKNILCMCFMMADASMLETSTVLHFSSHYYSCFL